MCGFTPKNLTVGLGWAPSPPYNPWRAGRLLSSSASLPLSCRSLQCPDSSFSCHHALGSDGYVLGPEVHDTLILSSSRGIQDVTGPCPEAAVPKERCGQRSTLTSLAAPCPACSAFLAWESRLGSSVQTCLLPEPFSAPKGGFLLEQGLIPRRG